MQKRDDTARLRPRLSASSLEIIVKALDLYIADLERQKAEQKRGGSESFDEFVARTKPIEDLLTGVKIVKVRIMRNQKGMRGRTHKPIAYFWGLSNDPFPKH